LVAYQERMNFELSKSNLKGVKEGSSRGGTQEYLINEVRNLRGKCNFESKLAKENMKRTKVDEELKALEEKMATLKLKCSRFNSAEKLCSCLVLLMLVAVMGM